MANHLWLAKQSEWECVACGQKESYLWESSTPGQVTITNNMPCKRVVTKDSEGEVVEQIYQLFPPNIGDCEVLKLAQNLEMYAQNLVRPSLYEPQSWQSYVDSLEKALSIMMEIDLKTPCGFQAKLAQFSKPYQR